MAKQTINNGDSGLDARGKINDNFTELYDEAVDVPAIALVDGATIDITGPKHTLVTATSRTFTNSHTGDEGVIEITLNATSATFTFPAAWMGISEGQSMGDNTVDLAGTSGDIYVLAWIKIGSNYTVAAKNRNR